MPVTYDLAGTEFSHDRLHLADVFVVLSVPGMTVAVRPSPPDALKQMRASWRAVRPAIFEFAGPGSYPGNLA